MKSGKTFETITHGLLDGIKVQIFQSEQNDVDQLNGIENDSENVNANQWFSNEKLRKESFQKIKDLINKRMSLLLLMESIYTKCTMKTSRRRFESLIDTLDYVIKEGIFYYKQKMIYKKSIKIPVDFHSNHSLLLTLKRKIVPFLASGNCITIKCDKNSAIEMAFIIDILHEASLLTGIITFVIQNELKAASFQLENRIGMIFESADFSCFAENLLSFYIFNNLKGFSIFVQQSVYDKFSRKLKDKLANMINIGGPLSEDSDLIKPIEVNYDAIDIETSLSSNGINIFKFRSIDEAKSIINHFAQIHYLSIWAKETFANLFSMKITSSSNIFINCIEEIQSLDVVMDTITKSIDAKSTYFVPQIENALNAHKRLV